MTYILILIGFLVVVFFLKKFTTTQVQNAAVTYQKNNPFEGLARELGLQYEEMKKATDKNTYFSVGSRLFGEYKGIPIEWVSASTAESASFPYTYQYSMQKTITLKVKNSSKKSFDIVPKTSGMSGFSLIGDAIIPQDILEYFASLGWMHLTLKDTALTFHDTFYEQFHGVSGSMQMMNALHPIWKTSAQNWHMDVAATKRFLDVLVDLAKRSQLV